MNSFANTLFAMLFGWCRTVIQRVWSAAAEGRLSGFFTWLGDHWLWVALGLCLACTAADFTVWYIRWQPYKVWMTHLRAIRRFLRGEWRREKQFDRGYRDAVVPRELAADIAPAPVPAQEQWSEAEWAEPRADAPAPQQNAYFPAQEAEPPRQRVFADPEAYELPPMEAEDADAPLQAPVRRRRSEKHGKKRGLLSRRLAQITQDDEGMLDGLPPAVDRDAAFHEPVYPSQPTVTPAPWQSAERQQGSKR